VAYECKRRRREALNSVARLAFVEVAFFELTLMNVVVTIQARCKLRVIIRGRAFRRMTLFAPDSRMFPHQRVPRLGMCCNVECRRFESTDSVAANTVASVRPPRELIRVLIGVTVRAAGAGNRNAEVGCLVARLALEWRVASSQWIASLVVIEILRNDRTRCLPSARAVALPTCGLECTPVRITVTCRAIRERNIFVTGGDAWRRHVATLAENFRVQSSQGKPRELMVEV
jgi:hypothetical protein